MPSRTVETKNGDVLFVLGKRQQVPEVKKNKQEIERKQRSPEKMRPPSKIMKLPKAAPAKRTVAPGL